MSLVCPGCFEIVDNFLRLHLKPNVPGRRQDEPKEDTEGRGGRGC